MRYGAGYLRRKGFLGWPLSPQLTLGKGGKTFKGHN